VVEDYLYNKHLIKIKMEMKLFTLLLASIAIIITLSVFVGLNINNQDAFIENDSDNDGIPDTEDDLPFDPSEQNDTDGDGVGDNSDMELETIQINSQRILPQVLTLTMTDTQIIGILAKVKVIALAFLH